MFEFKLPDLGEGIHEAEVLKWFVAPGDTIKEDAPLVNVETDKAAVVIPSPRSGRLVRFAGKPGETVTVGQVMAVIDDGTGAASATEVRKPEPEKKPEARAAAPGGAAVPAAPATRKLARELGVDLRLVPASGPGGRVSPEDVRAFATPPQAALFSEEVQDKPRTPSAPGASNIPFLDLDPLPDFSQFGPVEIEELRSIRRKVAHRMVTAKILVPHVAHMDEADVTNLEAFRKRERERFHGKPGGHLTLLPFVMRAVLAGLKQTPAFNASLDPFKEEIIFKKYYGLGFACDTGKGLVVPVVRDADRKTILQLSAAVETLAAAARDGTILAESFRGGTFTITNVGPLGGTALIPAVNYPEVAILGMGRVQEKPVVRDGQIVIRSMLPLTLAFDHRIADGADAARFVTEVVRLLSDPSLLMLEA